MTRLSTPPENQAVTRVRVAGLDILRVLAIVCVIGGHYFLNTDFNKTPFDNPMLFVLGMLQTFMAIGVPIFLMITGYLNVNKVKPSRKYFKGIWRVIIAYLFFAIVTAVFRKYYLGHEGGLVHWALQITSFDAIPYGWYVEMWIGLFLLTPFLNVLWDALESKRDRIVLILVLFACCSLPDFTNRYGVHLLPGYWVKAAYPFLCFFLGRYIREYRPSVKPILLISIIVALCLFNPIGSLILAHGRPMMHLQGSPCGIVAIPLAICVFLLFYKNDIRSSALKSVVTKISLLSLDMYLAAYIIDQLVYPLWKSYLGDTQSSLACFYPLIVLSLVIAAFLTAWAKDLIFKAFAPR